MKHTLAILLLGLATSVWGQTTLSNFDNVPNFGPGSWSANSNVSGGLLTIGGSAVNDGSFLYVNSLPDWSAYKSVQITARVDSGNTAGLTFNFYADTDFGTTFYTQTVSSSLFGSTLTTVNIPFDATFNPSSVDMWGITTEAAGTSPFRMTFDSISLSTTVPEPATYAAILGFVTLGLVGYRRFRRR